MSFFGGWFRSRRQRTSDLDAEIQSHIDMGVRDRIAVGMSPENARAEAIREFGNVTQVKQTSREVWRSTALENLLQDVRYAMRTLNRSRGFSFTAIATLAVGISAATVIFSVADHVVLRPLSYPDSERMFVVQEQIRELRDKFPAIPANAGHYLEWQRLCRECESIAAMREDAFTYDAGTDVSEVGTVRASSNMLPLLGGRAMLGRLFTEADDGPAPKNVVVLTYPYWRRKFGADSSIVGKSIQLNNAAWLVIGVLAPDFFPPKGTEISDLEKLPSDVEIFVPLGISDQERNSPGDFDFTIIGKFNPNATLAQVQSRLTALQNEISSRRPDKLHIDAITSPLQAQMLGTAGQGLMILLAAVGAILLIVCVNLTNLLLARQASRAREAAVRVALGASQGRLVRQTLIESVLIAIAGGALGVLLSRWGLKILLHYAPPNFPRLAEVTLDMRVMTIAAFASVITGLIFGVVPALRHGRVQPGHALKSGTRSMTDGRSTLRTRAFLIASQMGLSAALLYASGLFLASFIQLLSVDKGFTATQVLAMNVSMPRADYFRPDQRVGFYDEVLQRLGALPGVRSAGVISVLPLEGERETNPIAIENDPRPVAETIVAGVRRVDPGYFAAMGVVVKRGRLITASDRNRRVAMLSEGAAHALWPNEDAIGKRMVAGNDSLAEVVGIVGDVRTASIERPGSLIAYIPYWNRAPLQATLMLRTTENPEALSVSARSALREVGKTVAVSNIRTIKQVVSTAVAPRRFQLLLLMIFAVSALVIASIGIYGVISHSLTKRSNEIGVRMALGAERGAIHRLVLIETLKPVFAGLSLGVSLALVGAQLFRALLFEVKPMNAPSLIAVVVLLGIVAVVACMVPARRASGLGALLALRNE